MTARKPPHLGLGVELEFGALPWTGMPSVTLLRPLASAALAWATMGWTGPVLTLPLPIVTATPTLPTVMMRLEMMPQVILLNTFIILGF